MASINSIVKVLPGVLGVGGSNLVQNGLVLTESARVPTGVVLSFATAAAVLAYFGPGSLESVNAPYYFNGYDGATTSPGALLFAQFPYAAASSAFLRGGSFGAIAFASSGLTAITSGAVTLTIDGAVLPVTGVNFSAQTSYSGCASTLQTAIQAEALAVAQTTATASLSGTTMTVSAALTGKFYVGQQITGTGITAGTTIVSFGSYTTAAGTGTITVSQAMTTESGETVTGYIAAPTVTFDSVLSAFLITSGNSGTASTITFPATATALATAILLNQTNGAVDSQGVAQLTNATLGAAMTAISAINSNWTGFSSTFEPAKADKVTLAQWNNGNNYDTWYAMWDSDQTPLQGAGSDTTSAGYQINLAGYNGVLGLAYDASYATVAQLTATAFASLGVAASINFSQKNGRIKLSGRTQAGLATTVSNSTYVANLSSGYPSATAGEPNWGYSFYGAFSGQGNNFNQFRLGQITGAFAWWDAFINQIWLNNACQVTLAACEMQNGNFPYTQAGYNLIRSYLINGVAVTANGVSQSSGPIGAALNFGAINPGITLSGAQIAALQSAGVSPAALVNNGFYLQVLDPGPTVRAARGSPIINLWYCDGGQIQMLTLTSTDVQ